MNLHELTPTQVATVASAADWVTVVGSTPAESYLAACVRGWKGISARAV